MKKTPSDLIDIAGCTNSNNKKNNSNNKISTTSKFRYQSLLQKVLNLVNLILMKSTLRRNKDSSVVFMGMELDGHNMLLLTIRSTIIS